MGKLLRTLLDLPPVNYSYEDNKGYLLENRLYKEFSDFSPKNTIHEIVPYLSMLLDLQSITYQQLKGKRWTNSDTHRWMNEFIADVMYYGEDLKEYFEHIRDTILEFDY